MVWYRMAAETRKMLLGARTLSNGATDTNQVSIRSVPLRFSQWRSTGKRGSVSDEWSATTPA